MNPNNNNNFNDEALRINRQLKRDNDALKEEIKSLWADVSELEQKLAWHTDNDAHLVEDEYADKGMSRSDFIDKEYT